MSAAAHAVTIGVPASGQLPDSMRSSVLGASALQVDQATAGWQTIVSEGFRGDVPQQQLGGFGKPDLE